MCIRDRLNNERFTSKAPQAKIDEEKAKLVKYTQMLEQVTAIKPMRNVPAMAETGSRPINAARTTKRIFFILRS